MRLDKDMSNSIITKSQIKKLEPEERTHFLNENAMRLCRSLGDKTDLKGLGVHFIVLSPGKESTAYHYHHNEDECIYMVSGSVELTIGGETYQISAGDFVAHPAGGQPHVMKNNTKSDAEYLVVGQRLEDDIVDYPELGKRLYLRGNASDLVDIENDDA